LGKNLIITLVFLTEASLKTKTAEQKIGGLAVFQPLRSGWKIHDFASPPRDGFAFSMHATV
jgi:hypothetical protein